MSGEMHRLRVSTLWLVKRIHGAPRIEPECVRGLFLTPQFCAHPYLWIDRSW